MVNRRWWDLAAIAVVVVIVGFGLVDPPYGADDRASWATAGAFLLVHFSWGRRCVPVATPLQHLAVAIVYAALLAIGTAIEPSFSFLQAFLYPFVWSTSPSTRNAIIANLLIAVAIVAGYSIRDWPGGLVVGTAVAALSVGFSIALGLWITRIAMYGEERARLLDELQAAQGQLAAMHRESGVTDERARLAREIHDTIAQSLTGLVMVAQRAGNRLDGGDDAAARTDLALIEEMAREALGEARGLVAVVSPVALDTTLADALGRLGAAFERETGVRVEVEVRAPGLGRELEVVLLRAAQEGLANVRKHAGADRAWLAVEETADTARLIVRDDGVGPGDAAVGDAGGGDAEPFTGGFGLAGIRDRVAYANGRVSFGPDASGGSRLVVELPLGAAVPNASPVAQPNAAPNAAPAPAPSTATPPRPDGAHA